MLNCSFFCYWQGIGTTIDTKHMQNTGGMCSPHFQFTSLNATENIL